MPEPVNYILKNGALLHEFGKSEYYAHNVSDEIAEYFLGKNPEDIVLFQKFPSDWKQRIEKKAPKAVEPKAEPQEVINEENSTESVEEKIRKPRKNRKNEL